MDDMADIPGGIVTLFSFGKSCSFGKVASLTEQMALVDWKMLRKPSEFSEIIKLKHCVSSPWEPLEPTFIRGY